MTSQRPFSLPLYLLVVCLLSWPFQFAYLFLGEDFRPLLLLSMVMAGVGTWLAARFIFGDGLGDVGWRIGKLRYYLAGLALALFLWLFPVLLERVLGIHQPAGPLRDALPLFLSAALFTLIPALGEEVSWRGYLLPKLLQDHSVRHALLKHGLLTWFWHLPFLLATGLQAEGNPVLSFFVIALISLVPAVLHAVIFAWFWQASGSLWVVTFYHVAFDEVRDSLQASVGFSWLGANWQMLIIIILGGTLLWRSSWKGLQARR